MTRTALLAAASLLVLAGPAAAQGGDGLLFRASADRSLDADVAGGDPQPNFRAKVDVVPDGRLGGAARWADDGYVAWKAPGNIRSARGTLSFFWRSREPVGIAPFNIFRIGFADHSSWDMAFGRIDWNGHGFDAFVTDANLARVRVSWRMPTPPTATAWTHIAFTWDETVGVRLFVDGREVARKDQKADLDAGLDQFGMAARVLSPHQVQSRYNFTRGSDLDEIRVYDRMLDAPAMAALAAGREPAPAPTPAGDAGRRQAWLHRYGWDAGAPPLATDAVTRVRKVEFADTRDQKQWMWKGVDGIAETTWPGVYNRSRLPGRNDYFTLPDWNTYAEGGRRYDLAVPPTERFNQIELRGAAHGTLTWDFAGDGSRTPATLLRRPAGVVRSIDRIAPRTGGTLHFSNTEAEEPIQELWAYDIGPGAVPAGKFQLSYTVDTAASPRIAPLEALNAYIAGRFAPEERSTVIAMPTAGLRQAVGAGSAAGGDAAPDRPANAAPIVHILVPASFDAAFPDRPIARAWDYGWQNLSDGLDGIALDLPAIGGTGAIPLNIKVRDPLWPGRDMMDLSVSVPAGEARTLWLDLRDRILPAQGLFVTIASADPGFSAASLNGAKLRLVFKPRSEAVAEHVADRFAQVRDNWGFLVEEHTASKREGLYARVFADISDLLRVDPDHVQGRAYWADIGYRPENLPPVTLPPVPAGTPAWAFRQVEELKLVRRFVDWWIDERQVPYGDFGGGMSDDSDLVQQWPGVALMGVEPNKLNASLRSLSDAIYRNGMVTNGLGTITTDELHAYEEGLNADAARLYLNWGEPKAVERLMATTRALGGVILPNPAGHRHFASNWYGATTMYREGPWEWQKPYSFTVMHGPMLLGLYNAHPAARALVTGVVDGWMAHGVQGTDGRWSYPNEINWRTDATRVGDGGGASTPLQSAWAAWRYTGDRRYLRPWESRIARGDVREIGEAAALVPGLPAAKGDGDLAALARFDATGDPAPLAAIHADGATEKTQRMYMLTEGHWWSDRVDMDTGLLQRERLGGVALRRNQGWPGHTVSWRFAEPAAGEKVAILVRNATRDGFAVVAYNLSDRPQAASMTGWNVTAGEWTMEVENVSGKAAERPSSGQVRVALERGAAVPVTFAPGANLFRFKLARPTTPVETRPDLGIGADDVRRTGRQVSVTVHSLGSAAAPAGVVRIVAADGRELSRAAVPAMAAPDDLRPRTTTVRMALPRGADQSALAVEVTPADGAPEVTRANNRVTLPR